MLKRIYITAFDPATKIASAASSDSGFPSIEAAIAVFGPGDICRGVRSVTYPGGVFLSDYVVRYES